MKIKGYDECLEDSKQLRIIVIFTGWNLQVSSWPKYQLISIILDRDLELTTDND